MTFPDIISHQGPVGLPAATGPVRAGFLCIACTLRHSVIYKIKTSQHIPSSFTFLCSLYVRVHYTHCMYRHQFVIFVSKYIFINL